MFLSNRDCAIPAFAAQAVRTIRLVPLTIAAIKRFGCGGCGASTAAADLHNASGCKALATSAEAVIWAQRCNKQHLVAADIIHSTKNTAQLHPQR